MVGLEIKAVISTNLLITSVEIQPQAVEGTAQPGWLAKELAAGDGANTHARRSPACSPTVRWHTMARSTGAVDLRPPAAVLRDRRAARRTAVGCSPPRVRSCRVGTAPRNP